MREEDWLKPPMRRRDWLNQHGMPNYRMPQQCNVRDVIEGGPLVASLVYVFNQIDPIPVWRRPIVSDNPQPRD